jgi:SH3-like domain-containing protein
MKPNHEKLLIAALAGLIIAGAAAFAVQPAFASGYTVDSVARVTGVAKWDVLNLRLWPAAYSQKIGELEPKSTVWIDRCIDKPGPATDWCLVEQGDDRGWVNAKFLTVLTDADI